MKMGSEIGDGVPRLKSGGRVIKKKSRGRRESKGGDSLDAAVEDFRGNSLGGEEIPTSNGASQVRKGKGRIRERDNFVCECWFILYLSLHD